MDSGGRRRSRKWDEDEENGGRQGQMGFIHPFPCQLPIAIHPFMSSIHPLSAAPRFAYKWRMSLFA
jgi:hypothetical protein